MVNKMRSFVLGLLFVVGAILLSGCDIVNPTPQPTPESTPPPVIILDTSLSAEGRLVPQDSVNLSFVKGGRVAEVLVGEGDIVNTGDVLARLGNREQLEAVIATAEFELRSAEQDLQSLYDDLDELRNLALQTLNDARQALRDAERRANSLGKPASQTDIDLAYTQVVFAENALDQAKKRFEPYANKPTDNLGRARLQVELSNAQDAYDRAVSKYNSMLGSANEFDINQANTDVEIAQGRLELAQDEYDLLAQGPDPVAVEAAQNRIDTAKAQLTAARANLDDLELRATINGKVVRLDLIAGEQVAPGEPVILLVDFTQWYIETEDLTEIDVVKVSIGQRATIVPDALPEVELVGEVVSVSDLFEEKRGEITYTVKIRLDDVDERLRWGMTVVATLEED